MAFFLFPYYFQKYFAVISIMYNMNFYSNNNNKYYKIYILVFLAFFISILFPLMPFYFQKYFAVILIMYNMKFYSNYNNKYYKIYILGFLAFFLGFHYFQLQEIKKVFFLLMRNINKIHQYYMIIYIILNYLLLIFQLINLYFSNCRK